MHNLASFLLRRPNEQLQKMQKKLTLITKIVNRVPFIDFEVFFLQ